MVVDLLTIMNEGIEEFIDNLQNTANSTEYLNNLKKTGEYRFLSNESSNTFNNMIVTPKEIDELIDNMSSVVARGINYAL